MILAYHSIFSMYGFWLPNDPRGSGSDYVAMWELFRYGPATKVDSRTSVAAVPHDRQLRIEVKRSLRHAPVEITGLQARSIVTGFRQACGEANYRVHACAILPNHVHLVIGLHSRGIRTIIGHLKSNATRTLRAENHWPVDRPLWGDHGWNVYLDSDADVRRAIRYVEQNPVKEKKRPQRWSLVTPFEFEVKARRKRRG